MADSISKFARSRAKETQLLEQNGLLSAHRSESRDFGIKPRDFDRFNEDHRECAQYPGSDQLSRLDHRKYRKGTRSRRVPNLLMGAPLIPGPITPSFVPSLAPYASSPEWEQSGTVAIFPNFMLSPEVKDDDEGRSSEFLREAVHNTLGFPRLVVDSTYVKGYSEAVVARNARAPSRLRPETPPRRRPPQAGQKRFESKPEDFPQLGSQSSEAVSGVEICTPSPLPKMKQARFPSKNQLKKKC